MDSHSEEQEKVIEMEGDDDGGWVDTHHFAGESFTLIKQFITKEKDTNFSQNVSQWGMSLCRGCPMNQ